MKIDSLNNINNTQQKNSTQNLNGNVSILRSVDEGYKNISVNPNTNSNCYEPGSLSNLRDTKQDLQIVKQLFLFIDSLTEIDNGLGVNPTSEMLKEATTQVNTVSDKLIAPSLMLIVELVSLVFKGDAADIGAMNEIMKSITSKDPKVILIEVNQLLYKKMQQLKAELSKDTSIDPSLLKLITKYIDELADQISAAVIMAISAVDQGLKAIRKLIDKILDFAKEIFRGQDLESIEKMLQQISDILNMIDQILLFLIMKLASLHKTDESLDQNKNDNIIG